MADQQQEHESVNFAAAKEHAKLSEQARQHEIAGAAAAMETQQLRQQVSELQARLSEEERQR
eukprot:6649236-Pyramimonas_sp.AAC.1